MVAFYGSIAGGGGRGGGAGVADMGLKSLYLCTLRCRHRGVKKKKKKSYARLVE